MAIITLIPGDGIGPEITDAVVKILDAAGAGLSYDIHDAGITALEKQGTLIPEALLESVRKHKVSLKGPITTPVGEGFRSINVTLRQEFDLYQNVRPCKTIKGIDTKFDNIDIVLFRENTEGLYSGLELFDARHQIYDSIARVSYMGCERIVRAAFEYAVKHGRKRVTIIHKANILKSSSAFFLQVAKTVAKEFESQVAWDDKIIDNMCMQLVAYPERYDVLVTTNLFGDIISDLTAALVGGLGVVPGANIGKDCAIFEAVHGSAPDIAGQDKANPTAFLQSAIMMLRHLDLFDVANNVETALFKTLAQKELCTGDLGGKSGTKAFTECVIANLAK
ncbi:MAG: isocitrate/isopropylmalate dehydrogenase family protein [Bacteroidia bacterium]